MTITNEPRQLRPIMSDFIYYPDPPGDWFGEGARVALTRDVPALTAGSRYPFSRGDVGRVYAVWEHNPTHEELVLGDAWYNVEFGDELVSLPAEALESASTAEAEDEA